MKTKREEKKGGMVSKAEAGQEEQSKESKAQRIGH
jgi:hypothetical protein